MNPGRGLLRDPATSAWHHHLNNLPRLFRLLDLCDRQLTVHALGLEHDLVANLNVLEEARVDAEHHRHALVHAKALDGSVFQGDLASDIVEFLSNSIDRLVLPSQLSDLNLRMLFLLPAVNL